MTPTQRELWQKIQQFNIDGQEPPALTFAARLARENGWTHRHAERAITEYMRYIFLAMTAGFSVTPSEDVDTVWHMHLTYTRSYWKRFCGEVLGQPIHHEPTRGGLSEATKHEDQYVRTLAAYRDAFGHEVPADIWPSAEIRFGIDCKHRSVNTTKNWIIPKQPVKRVLQASLVAAAVIVLTTGCAGGLNPFELEGINYLIFLIPMMIIATVFGRVWRSHLHGPKSDSAYDNRKLKWEQIAYLTGGSARLTTAAIARLFSRRLILRTTDDRLDRGEIDIDAQITTSERAILDALPLSNDKENLKLVTESVDRLYQQEATQLCDDGLLLSESGSARAYWLPMVPIIAVMLIFGVSRLALGMMNGKPVTYLILTLVLGGLVALAIAAGKRQRTTYRGQAILNKLRKENDSLAKPGNIESVDIGMAVALFGTAMLVNTELASLQSWYPRKAPDNSSGGCSTGCSTSSGGDGGGSGCGSGCGGCGGGGD